MMKYQYGMRFTIVHVPFFVQHFKYIKQEVDRQQVGENCPQHDRFVEAHYNHPFCLVSLSGLGRWVVNPNILPRNGCRKS